MFKNCGQQAFYCVAFYKAEMKKNIDFSLNLWYYYNININEE
jgi:hypothetical protein